MIIKRILILAVLTLVLAIVACAAAPSILPFMAFSNRQHDVTFYTAQADSFSVDLPEGWILSEPSENPWGVEYYIGPTPLAEGMNSYVMILDPALHTMDADIERLGQQWSEATLTQLEASVDGHAATQVIVRFPDGSRTDVYYVPFGGRLYSLWFHNADSLTTRLDLVNSFRFSS